MLAGLAESAKEGAGGSAAEASALQTALSAIASIRSKQEEGAGR